MSNLERLTRWNSKRSNYASYQIAGNHSECLEDIGDFNQNGSKLKSVSSDSAIKNPSPIVHLSNIYINDDSPQPSVNPSPKFASKSASMDFILISDSLDEAEFMRFCEEGNVKMLRGILRDKKYISFLGLHDTTGRTPLHYACKSGNIRLVKMLIEEHEMNYMAYDKENQSVLYYACCSGNIDLLEYLVNLLQISLDNEYDCHGKNILITLFQYYTQHYTVYDQAEWFALETFLLSYSTTFLPSRERVLHILVVESDWKLVQIQDFILKSLSCSIYFFRLLTLFPNPSFIVNSLLTLQDEQHRVLVDGKKKKGVLSPSMSWKGSQDHGSFYTKPRYTPQNSFYFYFKRCFQQAIHHQLFLLYRIVVLIDDLRIIIKKHPHDNNLLDDVQDITERLNQMIQALFSCRCIHKPQILLHFLQPYFRYQANVWTKAQATLYCHDLKLSIQTTKNKSFLHMDELDVFETLSTSSTISVNASSVLEFCIQKYILKLFAQSPIETLIHRIFFIVHKTKHIHYQQLKGLQGTTYGTINSHFSIYCWIYKLLLPLYIHKQAYDEQQEWKKKTAQVNKNDQGKIPTVDKSAKSKVMSINQPSEINEQDNTEREDDFTDEKTTPERAYEEELGQQYWRKVKYTHGLRTNPATIMLLEFLSKAVLLWLIAEATSYNVSSVESTTVGTPTSEIESQIVAYQESIYKKYEIPLIVICVGDVFHEIGQIIEQPRIMKPEIVSFLTLLLFFPTICIRKLWSYFQNEWNIVDFLTSILLVLWMLFRFVFQLKYSVSISVISFVPIPLSFGLLRYLAVYKPFGELVLLIKGMLREVFVFILFYFVCIVGFGISFHGMLGQFTSDDSHFVGIGNTYWTLLQYTLDLGSAIAFVSTNDVSINIVGTILIVVFAIFTGIVLMNLLIAQMSNSYDTIKSQSQQQWLFSYTSLIMHNLLLREHSLLCMLPSPFNLLMIMLWPIHAIYLHRYGFSVAGTCSNLFYSYVIGTWCRMFHHVQDLMKMITQRIPKLFARKQSVQLYITLISDDSFAAIMTELCNSSGLLIYQTMYTTYYVLMFCPVVLADAVFTPLYILYQEILEYVEEQKLQAESRKEDKVEQEHSRKNSPRPYLYLEFVDIDTQKILFQREAMELTRASNTATYPESTTPWSRTTSSVTSPRLMLHQSLSHKHLPSFLYYYQLSSQNHAIEEAAVKPLTVSEEKESTGWEEEEEEWVGNSIFRDDERTKLLQPFANEAALVVEKEPRIPPQFMQGSQVELVKLQSDIIRVLRQFQQDRRELTTAAVEGSTENMQKERELNKQVDHILHEMSKLETR